LLACFPAGWVLVVLTVWAGAEKAAPAAIDHEYLLARDRVRATAAADDRPLAVVAGSSRITWAFHPSLVEGDAFAWSNAAHFGAGPVFQRILVRRLLRDGVRPDVLVLEVLPTFYVCEEAKLLARHLTAEELLLARRYWPGVGLEYRFVEQRLLRVQSLSPEFDPRPTPRMVPGGYASLPESIPADERARRTAAMKRQHGWAAADLRPLPGAVLALRDTLREATAAGARVVLLLSPEGETFRGWYDPGRLAEFDQSLRDMATEFAVPIIDARAWLHDGDFSDSHHVIRAGSLKFTTRLPGEVRQALGHP
jgi:hypothetical protein